MLIDLGTTAPADAVFSVRRRSVPVSGRQWVAAAIVLVLALVALNRSGRPADPPLTRIGSVPITSGASFMVSGSRVIVVGLGDTRVTSTSGAALPSISAYALASGRRLWTHLLASGDPSDIQSGNVQASLVGSTIVMTDGSPMVWGFDVRTGRQIWSFPTGQYWQVPGGLLMSLAGPVVQFVDAATGAIRWRDHLASGCSVDSDIDGGSILEICPATQELIRIDVATGHILADRVVDLAGKTSSYVETIEPEVLEVGPAVIIVAVQDRTRIVLSAFRTSDLAPLWTNYPVGADAHVSYCAPVLCIDDGSGALVAVDPTTRQRRELPASPRPLPMSVAFTPRFGLNEVIVVPVGQTQLINDVPIGIDFESTDPIGTFTLARPWSNGAGNELWIGRQVRTGNTLSVRPVGQLHDVGESCVAQQGEAHLTYLACTTSATRLTFWRIE